MQTEEVQGTQVPDEVRQVHHCECGTLLVHEPILKCRKCGELLRLRCFYYKDGSRFVAECVDLDLSVERPTAEEAVRELQIAMYGYLTSAFDGQDIRGLVPRRSPLSHRLRYRWENIKARLSYGAKKYPSTVVDTFFEVPGRTHCY